MKVKVFNSQTQAEITELDLDEVFAREDACLIGRSASSGLVLESSDISRLHGKFFLQNGEINYTDLGSRNGSLINGEAAVVNQVYSLKPGDVVQAGEFVLIIQETSYIPEDVTVVKPLDAEEIAAWRFNATKQASTADPEAVGEVVEADIIAQPGALVKAMPNIEADDAKQQTLALFAAVNKRVLNELQGAGHLTRDVYLKTVRKALQKIENNVLIDPEEIEKQAEKQWQTFTKGTSEFSGRLGSAAVKKTSQLGSQIGSAAVKRASGLKNRIESVTKAAFNAAWKEITTPKPNSQSVVSHKSSDSLENKVQSEANEEQKE
ncbi:MAG TPA: FHA domain-containing protein [Leptolyngbyaceae cyanobacterium]